MNKHRGQKGRYASIESKVWRILALLPILIVFHWHYTDAINSESNELGRLRQEHIELLNRQEALTEEGIKLQTEPKEFAKTAKVTSYSCGGLKTEAEILMNCPNGITASGTIPTPRMTLACDKSLLGKSVNIAMPDGTTLTGICEDTGGKIGKDNIDLYLETVDESRAWGVKYLEYEVIN